MYLNLINRFDPWREVSTLQNEMNRLFDNFGTYEKRAFPAVNLWTNRETATVTAELPGLENKDIKLSVLGNELSIEGERHAESLEENEFYHRQERKVGPFKRTVQLPFPVDDSKIKATLKHGVLTITLHRAEEDKPKKITIS